MLIERRNYLPNENPGWRIERRQHRRQFGNKINHDFALQAWEPIPDIKKVRVNPVLEIFLVAEIAVIAVVIVGWLS